MSLLHLDREQASDYYLDGGLTQDLDESYFVSRKFYYEDALENVSLMMSVNKNKATCKAWNMDTEVSPIIYLDACNYEKGVYKIKVTGKNVNPIDPTIRSHYRSQLFSIKVKGIKEAFKIFYRQVRVHCKKVEIYK